ncbi:MAG: hypothetical protein LAP61_23300 [Acidobacteriia bacterium]|nr:hypothetical protein [Terriglobia bacterium]
MELERADLNYFVMFVLLDEAKRYPIGKRWSKALRGFWITRSREPNMRVSDRIVRRNVCIEALKVIGRLPVTMAAIDVGIQIGQSTDAEVDVIRTSYYDRGVDKAAWNVFWGSFLSWREWVLTSPQARLDFFLNQYESEQGRARRRSLEKLFEDLRSDEVQAARNRNWALERCQSAQARIESNQWDPNADWKSLATDHSEVGRFRAAFGQVEEAISHLIQALEIWQARGQEMPRIQDRAVPQLEAAIAYLQSLGRRPGEKSVTWLYL